VAHLNIQDVNVVIVFPGETFDHKPEPEKHEIGSAFQQLCARGAGIAGIVVPVWLDSFGRMKFIAHLCGRKQVVVLFALGRDRLHQQWHVAASSTPRGA
jgi:hypothetical protein